MKKFLFWCMLIIISLTAADSPAATTKVLINVVQERGDAGSSSLIKETEMLIAKELLDKNFEVMTSDDFSTSRYLTREDADVARSGSMPELRKAAGANGAAFVVSAKASTDVSQEQVLNMQMNKATTAVAYRIVNTASGKTLDMGTVSFSSSGRSAGEATNSNYRKMSADIARLVSDKIPAKLSAQDSEKLSGYKAALAPKPEPVKVAAEPAAAPAPVVAQATATPAPPAAAPASAPAALQNAPAATPAPAPAEGPEIVILNPPATRGFVPVAHQKELNIEGMAIDPKGISEVRINGEKVDHDPEGRFSHRVNLGSGDNHFLIMAVNTAGRMVSKELNLDRQEDKDPPEVVLLRPDVTRGFAVSLPPKEKSTTIEGIVKDDSGILFVRVNDQDVPLSDNGHFQQKVALNDSTGSITIEAADVHGNISRKTLGVTRGGEGGLALTASTPAKENAPPGPAKKPVLWGLAVGVSKYSSSSINLKYADQDALNLEKFFKAQEGKSFSEVHFKTLVNENVTRNSIIEAITQHLGQAAPNDVIFIFLAGHGTQHRQSGSYYFMPSNSDFENLLSTGLRMSDFEESVKILSNNVDKIIVAMDTCQSGALQVGTRGGGGGEDLAGAINAASGLYILSASKAGEASLESEHFKLDSGSGDGAFTYALISAMRGEADYDKDGYVSLNEMFQFVARQVPRLTNGQQHPYFRMQGTDLPLVKIQ